MAFRGVPGGRARHTPPVRCAHPGTRIKRGILRVLRHRYSVDYHCFMPYALRPPSPVFGLRSLTPRDPSTPLRFAQDDRDAWGQTARLAAPGF